MRSPSPGGAVRECIEALAEAPNPTGGRESAECGTHHWLRDSERSARGIRVRRGKDQVPLLSKRLDELQSLRLTVSARLVEASSHMVEAARLYH